jgi:hypothetical protein
MRVASRKYVRWSSSVSPDTKMKKPQSEPKSVWGLTTCETKYLDSQAGSGGTGDNNRRRRVNAEVVNPGIHELVDLYYYDATSALPNLRRAAAVRRTIHNKDGIASECASGQHPRGKYHDKRTASRV